MVVAVQVEASARKVEAKLSYCALTAVKNNEIRNLLKVDVAGEGKGC